MYRKLLAAALLAAATQAGVISTSANVDYGIADPNYTASPYSRATLQGWAEQVSYVLTSDITLDSDLADPTKTYGNGGGGTIAIVGAGGPTITKGTAIDSYYFYYDPRNTASILATITFSTKVLGVVVVTSEFVNTDFLRVGSAPYPGDPAFSARGYELNQDTLRLSADGRTLTIDNSASNPGDQIRVITAAVPEPSTMGLAAAALIGLGFLRRR